MVNAYAITVEPGDTVYIPAGLPHAIGEGVFVVESNNPPTSTDLGMA